MGILAKMQVQQEVFPQQDSPPSATRSPRGRRVHAHAAQNQPFWLQQSSPAAFFLVRTLHCALMLPDI